MLGFPAVTLRDSIERPEALDTGGIIMTGLDPTTWSRRSPGDGRRAAATAWPSHARGLPHRQHERANRQLHPVHGAPA